MGDCLQGTSARFIKYAAALLTFTLIPLAAQSQAPQPGVFSEVQTAFVPRPNPALEPTTLRTRVVRMDPQKITAARRGREILKLNLFDDTVVEVQINRVSPTSSGYFISGRPKGEEWGEVRLVVNGPIMVGTVVTHQGKFTIRSSGSGRHVIHHIDPAAEPFECGVDDLPIPSSPPQTDRPEGPISSIGPSSAGVFALSTQQADDMPTEDGSEVRVLIVYTEVLQTRQGGPAGMRALIDLMIQSANQAFEDGGINPRLVLAHSAMVEYSAQSTGMDLDRMIEQNDGHMDGIHTLRNEHAADLIHLLTEYTVGPAGTAVRILNESLTAAEDKAFAVTATAHEETFTHEIGHNFGLRHDRFVDSPQGAIYPYAFGYTNKKAFDSDAPTSAHWRTIMAYQNRCREEGIGCPRVFRFSNPDQTYLGDPLGVPADDPSTGPDGPADARLTINNTARWVGSFRSQACTDFTVSPETILAPVGGGEIVFEVDADLGCLWGVEGSSEYFTVTSETPVAGPGFVNITVDENQSGAERSGTLTVAGESVTVRQLATSDGICGRTSTVVKVLTLKAGFADAAQCDKVSKAHLAQIDSLLFHKQGMRSLKAGDFEGLTGLTSLNLGTNQLASLPAGLFAGLSNLESLHISQNQLTELPAGIFSELSGLKSLYLPNNHLADLPEDVFADLSNLEELWLYGNRLAVLHASLFADLSSLQSLNLSHNELSHLPDDLFSDLPNLVQLNLFANQIAVIPEGIFADLLNLQELNLGYNPFASLPGGVFAGLSELEILNFHLGSLTELPMGVFADLSNLRDLDLTLNPLTELPARIFSGLTMLERLSFVHNSLTELPAGVFSDLSNLRDLDLNANHLTELPAGIFDGLSRLERLALSSNEFTNFPTGIFSNLTMLQDFDLRSNDLRSLPDGLFSGLASLKKIRLERNKVDPLQLSLSLEKVGINQFKAVAPAGAPFTLVLEVSASEGGAIGDGATTISIPSGAVESEPIGVMRQEGTDLAVNVDIGVLPSLPENHSGYVLEKDEDLPRWILTSFNPTDATLIGISVSDGNLDPDFAAATSNYAVSVSNSVSAITITPTTSNASATVSFFDANDQVLADADPDTDGHQMNLIVGDNTIEVLITAEDGQTQQRYSLTVTREESYCGRTEQVMRAIVDAAQDVEACGDLTRSHLSRITELELSGRSISSLITNDFSGLSKLETLGLEDNQLTRLPKGVFSGLHALDSLWLSVNQLEDLPTDVFSDLSLLRNLYLSQNQLGALPDGILSGLQRLEILWLNGNQLTSLEADLFSGLSRLQIILLFDNRLVSLPPDVFSGLSSLYELSLQRNELSSLEADVFSGLFSIRTLTLGGNNLTSFPVDVFSDLSELKFLGLGSNRLTSLPADVFSGLSKLERLELYDNQLTSLPDGVFSGLKALRSLHLIQGDDDLPLTLSLEKVGESELVAVVPSGSPLTLEIPINVSSAGMLEDDVDAIKVFVGELKSAPVSVTRVSGTTEAVTVDIGSIPGLPDTHTGYEFKNDEDLPLEILPAVRADDASLSGLSLNPGTLDPSFSSETTRYQLLVAQSVSLTTVTATPKSPIATLVFLDAADEELSDADPNTDGHQVNLGVGENTIKVSVTSQDGSVTQIYMIVVTRDGAASVCARTTQVRDAIVASVSGVSGCAHVTEAHLSQIATLDMSGNGVSSLKSGDFSGLTALTTLRLDHNQLRSLPGGLLSGLGMLQTLNLSGNAVDPVPLRISLEEVGESQFHAVVPAGAPFALELPVSVNSAGMFMDGASTLTVPAGELESEALSVYRVAGTEGAVQVDLGNLPSLPDNHQGYALEKGVGLPLEIRMPQVAPVLEQVTGVGVTAGVEQLEVSWTAVSEADGYKVQWKSGMEDYGESRQAVLTGSETVSHTITELTAGTEYTIQVIATKDNADDGPPSEGVTGVPMAMASAQVMGVEVAPGVGLLEVTWTTVSGAGGYKVQWKSGTEEYDETRQEVLAGSDTTSHTITGLVAGTEYTVRVIATKAHADDGLPSSEVTGIPKATPPDQVTGVVVTPGIEELAVLWTTVSDADRYKVQWKSGSQDYDESRQAVLTGSDTVSHTITELTAGTEYTVQVIATKDNADDGPPSVSVTGVPMAMASAQVTGVEVAPGVDLLEVTWTTVSGAGGYKVQWKFGTEEYDESRQAVLASGDTASYTITGLVAGTEYTVRVIATKSHADDGLPSSEATGVPKATPPDQVTSVEITPGIKELAVLWTAVSDADRYKVQWKSGSQDYAEAHQAVLTGGDTASHTITGLIAGTEYTVRVIATKAHADDGLPSNEVTGTPKATPPDQVTGVEITPGIEELAVMWTAVSDADRYKVQWKSGSQDYAEARQAVLIGTDTVSYTIVDLVTDTEYTIRVTAAKDNADDGVPSEEVTATPFSVNPDVNGDGVLDSDDAQVMYQSYTAADQVGDGETGGTASSRQMLLAGYAGKANPSDDDLKKMIRKANVWREAGVDSGGDINDDGEINESDALVMIYAYELENLVGNGTTGGTARFRQLLLASHANKANPTDEELKVMLRRANELRDDFG